MAPLLALCVLLMLASSWGTLAVPLGQPVGTHLQTLFSSPLQRSSAATSKRQQQQQQQPILIEPDNGFAFRRQHHYLAPLMNFDRTVIEGASAMGGDASHFRSLHDADTHLLNHHRHQPYFHGSPSVLETPDMTANLDFDRILAPTAGNAMSFPSATSNEDSGIELEFSNEIGDNPLFQQPPPTTLFQQQQQHHQSPLANHGDNNNNINYQNVESFDLIRERLERIKEEEDIEVKSNLLMRMLEELPEGPLPIVYIEDSSGAATEGAGRSESADSTESDGDNDDEEAATGGKTQPAAEEGQAGTHSDETQQFKAGGSKRSGRYYRRYPWKRQNSRSRPYDPDTRYLCVPSREDVFKLLVGLHENRVGNHQRTVNFCNRKRPAKAIFTNIRFLG